MKKISIMVLLIGGLLCTTVEAQSDFPLSISIMDESIGLPSYRLTGKALHPGVIVGTSFPLQSYNKASLLLGTNLGWFYHRKIAHEFFVNGEIAYVYAISERFFIEGISGLGYAHSFYPSEIYVFDENGNIVEKNQLGRGHALVNFGLGLGYNVTDKAILFTRYQFVIETPFANSFPVMPHTFFQVGATFYPFK